jgi:RHS repeat-associated protein
MPTDYGFTGQHSDSNTGLDYYNARYYDPTAGQFSSADAVLSGGGFDIWGLSRYAYVEGNPIICTDPSGNVLVVADGGGGCYPCSAPKPAAPQPTSGWNPWSWHWSAAGQAFHQSTSRYEGASAYQVAQAVAGDIDLYTFGALGRLDHAMGGHLAESQYYKQGQQIGTPFAIARVFLGGYGAVRGGYALYRAVSAARAAPVIADTGLVVRNPISAHAAAAMADDGITQTMVNTTIRTGSKFFDTKWGTFTYVLNRALGSGAVATNAWDGTVTTVMRTSRAYQPRHIVRGGTAIHPNWR